MVSTMDIASDRWKKSGMTQLFDADGTVQPATVIKAGPCVVVQAKTAQSDGYEAVQLGLVEEKADEGEQGHRRATTRRPACRRRACGARSSCKAGGEPVEAGRPGDRVDLRRRRARRRHRHQPRQGLPGRRQAPPLRRRRATHGSMFHRAPGSIGASSFPSRVVKGMRVGGHMGADA